MLAQVVLRVGCQGSTCEPEQIHEIPQKASRRRLRLSHCAPSSV